MAEVEEAEEEVEEEEDAEEEASTTCGRRSNNCPPYAGGQTDYMARTGCGWGATDGPCGRCTRHANPPQSWGCLRIRNPSSACAKTRTLVCLPIPSATERHRQNTAGIDFRCMYYARV